MNNHNFSMIPQVRFNRSKFPMSHGVKTSMSVGTLYPISCVEALPGDTFQSDISMVARVTSAFLKPVVDNAFMDIHTFFVPLRLVYSDLEKVFGDPNPSAYVSNTLADIPTFSSKVTVPEKTVWDYLGLPTKIALPKDLSVLPARAFALIYDKWFRNENVVNEMYIQKGAYNSSEAPNNNAWAANNYAGKLPKVSKKKDFFTSLLPKPQKAPDVLLPLGTTAPVIGNGMSLGFTDGKTTPTNMGVKVNNDTVTLGQNLYGVTLPSTTSSGSTASSGTVIGITRDPTKSGLVADLRSATAANINDIRFAFQLEKMFERDALYGSRYNEYLLGHFGVSSPDSRLQFPEYLGGGRIPIMVQQVEQTSEGTNTSPLANVAGYSLTNGHTKFSKGITEHGYIITVACIKTLHTYQQGIERMFMRKSRNDFYDPLFANLGNQPVYTTQIYVSGSENTLKDNVLGYSEAWAEYRYIPNRVSGEMRSNATNSLDIWHFADKYASAPTLSQSFVEETSANIDRTLAVPASSQDNFLVDFWFNTSGIRVMPVYSMPGLVDHH